MARVLVHERVLPGGVRRPARLRAPGARLSAAEHARPARALGLRRALSAVRRARRGVARRESRAVALPAAALQHVLPDRECGDPLLRGARGRAARRRPPARGARLEPRRDARLMPDRGRGALDLSRPAAAALAGMVPRPPAPLPAARGLRLRPLP